MVRVRARSLLGTLALGAAVGCGGKGPPPQLATTGAHVRAASRVELVDLVIADGARAAKVRSLYVQIEQLMLETKRAEARELLGLGAEGCPRSEDETRAAMKRFSAAERGALEKYIGLELELRRATTPEEFARLDAIK
jgi:hypothetical protein